MKGGKDAAGSMGWEDGGGQGVISATKIGGTNVGINSEKLVTDLH